MSPKLRIKDFSHLRYLDYIRIGEWAEEKLSLLAVFKISSERVNLYSQMVGVKLATLRILWKSPRFITKISNKTKMRLITHCIYSYIVTFRIMWYFEFSLMTRVQKIFRIENQSIWYFVWSYRIIFELMLSQTCNVLQIKLFNCNRWWQICEFIQFWKFD